MPVPQSNRQGLTRRLRKDEAFDRLLEAILDGTLVPGERIRDGDLQDWFGVSRTPIRLAIDRLEDLRLVESRPNRYTRVVPALPGLIPQTTDVMCALWVLGVRLSVERMTPDEVAESRRRLAEACRACREHDGADASQVVEAVRVALSYFSELSGNHLLSQMVVKLGISLRFQVSMQGGLLDTRLLESVFDRLSKAVEARDVQAATAVFDALLDGGYVCSPDPSVASATAPPDAWSPSPSPSASASASPSPAASPSASTERPFPRERQVE